MVVWWENGGGGGWLSSLYLAVCYKHGFSCSLKMQFPLLGVGMNAVPGGYFPLPSEVAHLMSRIPPPHCFNVSSAEECIMLSYFTFRGLLWT